MSKERQEMIMRGRVLASRRHDRTGARITGTYLDGHTGEMVVETSAGPVYRDTPQSSNRMVDALWSDEATELFSVVGETTAAEVAETYGRAMGARSAHATIERVWGSAGRQPPGRDRGRGRLGERPGGREPAGARRVPPGPRAPVGIGPDPGSGRQGRAEPHLTACGDWGRVIHPPRPPGPPEGHTGPLSALGVAGRTRHPRNGLPV